MPERVATKNLRGLYLARPKGTYTRSSGMGVAAAVKAAAAPYRLTSRWKGSIRRRVLSLMMRRPP